MNFLQLPDGLVLNLEQIVMCKQATSSDEKKVLIVHTSTTEIKLFGESIEILLTAINPTKESVTQLTPIANIGNQNPFVVDQDRQGYQINDDITIMCTDKELKNKEFRVVALDTGDVYQFQLI